MQRRENSVVRPVAKTPSPSPGKMLWLSVVVAVFATSTAVILIKATATPPIWLASERLLLAALLLAPLALRDARRDGLRPDWFRSAWLPGLFLAIHFASWAAGARLIPAANSTLIANFIPVVMPVVALLLLRERASACELAATAIGVGGVAFLAVGDLAGGHLAGNALCVLAMVSLAVYLALSRRLNRGSLWLYVTPLYAIAGALCAGAALLVEGPPPMPGAGEAVLVCALACVPTVIGHSLLNRAMGILRPQAVSVAALGNVPFAAAMAWILWRELPTPAFWVAGIACVIAIAMVVAPSVRQSRTAPA